MLSDVLQELSSNPKAIVELLSEYGCSKFKINAREIRFARDEAPSSGLNISIRLDNNDGIFVKDFAKSDTGNNIVSWLCKEKCVEYRNVMQSIRKILRLSDDWYPYGTVQLFGGIFDGIGKNAINSPCKIYDDSILNDYLRISNKMFLRDHISLSAQQHFNIGYDVSTDRITIPIYDSHGSIIGVKGRRNYSTENENDPKYLYLVSCQMSRTLYGYSQNYQYLFGNDVLIFEAEKSVMQAFSYGYNNAVSLGSNNLSETQARLIVALNPRNVIFMLDNNLELDSTMHNIETLRRTSSMRDFTIKFWNWENNITLDEKSSATDAGKEEFEYILNNEIEEVS